jgi:hypothetical protein
VITKFLIGGAIVLGAVIGAASPASADPSAFGTLSCSCHDVAPANGPGVTDKINRGIQQGLGGAATAPVGRQ